MGRLLFWSWFDVNRSTFDEGRSMHKNDFHIFVSSDLDLHLDLWPQICSPSYSCTLYNAMFPLN